MSYMSVDPKTRQIVRHTRRRGKDTETPLATVILECASCGYTTPAERDKPRVGNPVCLCGTMLTPHKSTKDG